jgi:hypothetical protein
VADLDRALATIVRDCLGVAAGQSVLVVGDPPSRALADATLQLDGTPVLAGGKLLIA